MSTRKQRERRRQEKLNYMQSIDQAADPKEKPAPKKKTNTTKKKTSQKG